MARPQLEDRNFDLLLAAGARPPAADPVDALLSLCAQGQQAAVRRELSRDPELPAASIEHPGAEGVAAW
jgi:hypothetical protein